MFPTLYYYGGEALPVLFHKKKMEPNSCQKDWFFKWTQIMIPMMKMAQNPYQPAELTWSVVSTLTRE